MTIATRPSAPPSADVSAALVGELRTMLDGHEAHQARSLVAEFVRRHNLTHGDVENLLLLLRHQPAPNQTAAPHRLGRSPAHVVHQRAPVIAEDRSDKHAVQADCVTTDSDLAEEQADDGPDWMFGEELEPPSALVVRNAVGKAFDDLHGDWIRSGGGVTRADVALVVTRRSLSVAQHGELLRLLGDAGVELLASVEARPVASPRLATELDGDSIRLYLREISRYPLINASREVELWSLMRQGGAAREELDSRWTELSRNERRSLRSRIQEGLDAHSVLVCANLRLVVSIAKARRYHNGGVEFADRIQHGNLGLMHAAHRFDGSKGYKFSTYATWWIRQHIERGIADQGRVIRIPVHIHKQVQKVRKAARSLTARLDREPSPAEIADATGLTPGTVQAMLEHQRPTLSLDMFYGDEGSLRLSDLIRDSHDRDGRTDPAEIIAHVMLHEDIMRTLHELLPERAVTVIQRRFGLGSGEPKTLDEIGVQYAVTRERIRQIQAKSMATLREHEGAAALRAYVTDESASARVVVSPPRGNRDE